MSELQKYLIRWYTTAACSEHSSLDHASPHLFEFTKPGHANIPTGQSKELDCP
jgi:hypothetical protein